MVVSELRGHSQKIRCGSSGIHAARQVPTYIPGGGYQISNVANSDLFKKIVFENQDKDSLLTYMELSEGNTHHNRLPAFTIEKSQT